MPHVSRPLIAVLAATVLLFALWVVALKPSGHGAGSSSSQGLGRYQGDINAAHQAVKTADAASGRAGGDPTASTATPAQPAPSPAHSSGASPPAATARASVAVVRPRAVSRPAVRATTAQHAVVTRFAAVQQALRSHKVLALLFYNPAGADDLAVRQELGTVPAHAGRVFKLAIPLSEIQNYLPITNQVPVNVSPTLVFVAADGRADEIVGYTDPFEISQRVDDALALGR